MAQIYSQVIYHQYQQLAGSWVHAAAVPAGQTWVVRDITVMNDEEVGGWTLGFAVADSLFTPIFAMPAGRARVQTLYHWDGRQVLAAGDYVQTIGRDVGWSFRISGYKFTS